MSTPDKPVTGTGTAKPKPVRPPKFKVRKYVEGMDTHPVLFAHEDETQAKRYIKQNHPRGKEVYLESPDGTKTHYSADHAHQGSDDDLVWQEWPDDDDDE
jgi:hypothetical protein